MSKNKLINSIKYTNNNRLVDVAMISSNDTRIIKYLSMEDKFDNTYNSYKQENNILGAYYYYLADYYLIRD